ncbi:hypothetical protein CHS0354_014259, partial [Potamilus streckersoni]
MYTSLKDLPEGKNWTLDELNDKEVQLLIPVILFISISLAVGTAGKHSFFMSILSFSKCSIP